MQVPGSVLAYTDMYMLWRPRTLAEVTVDSLAFLQLISPSPEVLVLGCGARAARALPADVQKFLDGMQVKVELLDSVRDPPTCRLHLHLHLHACGI